ncbi:VanW family protein [Peribacillus asahii]|uniref:VanW family protein n=1 Tax=Peribacillus asahii TaxID=228899 RepID=UPI0037FB874B
MKFAWLTAILLFIQPVHPSDDLLITHQGQTIAHIPRSDFMIALPDTPMVDRDKYNQLIEEIDKQIYKAPVEAGIDNAGNIIPGQTGYKLYKKIFEEQFYTSFFGSGTANIEVPLLPIHPRVDSELLAHIRVQKIGQYVTYFNSENKNRTQNISLAAEAINNHVVFPGEIFSFNKVVGRRTAERGYLPARVIVKGEFSEGIGGGICQVSSTLFNAIDRTGMEIMERYSHSRRVPYVPPGRDATVSWYGPDFSFKNNYNQPILIRAIRYGGQVIITIYSSDDIDYKARNVPQASYQLSKEVSCSGVNICE